MRRRELLRGAILLAALVTAPPLLADPVTEITRQLRADGFEVREIGRTWLRRVRIVAESPNERREVVFDPATGEIRRDYITERRPDRRGNDGRDDRSGPGGGGGGESGRARDDDDDDDDDDDRSGPDDDDDDDDDDDPSGHGGGGDDGDRSGRGGGNDEDRSGRGGGDDEDRSGRGGGDDDDDDD